MEKHLFMKKKIVLTTVHCKSSNVNRVRLMNLIRWEGCSYSGFVLYLKILVVVKYFFKYCGSQDIFACSILQTTHLGKGYLSCEFLFCLQKFSIFACQKKIFPRAKDRVMCKLLWFELHFGHNSILFYSSLPPVLSNAKKKTPKPSNLSDHNHQLKLVMLMCLGLNLKLNCENSVISSPCNNILASCIKNSPFMWIYWKITPK